MNTGPAASSGAAGGTARSSPGYVHQAPVVAQPTGSAEHPATCFYLPRAGPRIRRMNPRQDVRHSAVVQGAEKGPAWEPSSHAI
jgi:hypothetical protein